MQLCSCAPEKKKKRIEQKQRCDEIFKTKASVWISYIVSGDIHIVYLDFEDFLEVEDAREKEKYVA